MAGYTEEQFWANQNNPNAYDGFEDQSQTLDFQSFDQNASFFPPNAYAASQHQQGYGQPSIFTPDISSTTVPHGYGGAADMPGAMGSETNEFDEPPLLDELEIYPQRIMEKSLAVLNPFHAQGLVDNPEYFFKETDLAGPICFCFTLAACLFVSGNKAQFGYIYGLCIISVVVMYVLITLMCNSMENYVTITAVASILGYSILPIVWLSIVGVFFSLDSAFGIALAACAIFLSTMSCSRIFCIMTGDPHQRYLIAYPCALVYIIFTLLVLF
ncbi:protein YIPF7 [Toxorhynchites rutilus septentrionalis]|uniref:protein YIPF7 n=1 Tax=Toxorhynchites rutilus septentrionalis TaxID=329112 RepID=UPI00247AF24E|nr:protein YIPF7 [Toxorhynchites rutilus septentrionalis]